MPQIIVAPNGDEVQFPDEVDDATITSVMRKEYAPSPATAPAASTDDQPGIGDDLAGTWTAFRRGTERLKQSFFGSGVGAAVTVANEATQAQKDLKQFDAMVASNPTLQASPMTAGQRNNLVSKLSQSQNEAAFRGQTLGSNIAQVAKTQRAIKALPATGGLKEFQEGDWVQALKHNPIEVAAGLIAESLPQMAPGLLMSVSGGPAAGAVTAGVSSLGIETATGVLDSLRDEGMNLEDEASIRAFFNDPDRVERARDKATMRGVPIAAMDAFTAGMAGKILKTSLGKGAARLAAGIAGEVGMQAAGGAGGEAAAQLMSEGQISDPRSIAAEAIAEIGSAPAEVYGGMRHNRQAHPTAQAQTSTASVRPEAAAQNTSPSVATPAVEVDSMDALLSTAPTITPDQAASASVLGADPTELRHREAVATGQPIPVSEETTVNSQEAPIERALQGPENVDATAVEAPLTAQEGQDTTPDIQGLSTLDAETFQRLSDQSLQEGWSGYQDPQTFDVFQVPPNATPVQVEEARLVARNESKAAEFAFLKADQDRQLEADRAERESLEPLARKALVPSMPATKAWDSASQLQFILDRELPALAEADKNVKRAESGTLTKQGQKVAAQEAQEEAAARRKKVEILQRQLESLNQTIPPAKEAAKKMQRPQKGQEGSTQIPQAVVDAGRALYRKGVEFKDWSASMVKNLGQNIRPFLKRIWDGIVSTVNRTSPATNPQAGGILGFGSTVTTTTPEAYSKSAFQRGLSRFWLGQYGAYPKAVRDLMEQKNMKQGAIVDNGVILGRDLKKEITATSKRTGIPEDLIKEDVSKMLEGQPGTINDPDLDQTVAAARHYIDSMSLIAMSSGAVKGPMVDTFRTNLGQWLRRYYNAFDPEANWNYDSLVRQAWKDGAGRTTVKDPKIAKILTDAERLIHQQNPAITTEETEAVMRDLTDRNQLAAAFLGGANAKIRKDVSSLIRRKQISPEIRALMGEETNPLLRYEKSTQFMAQLLAKHEAQKALRTMGLANGLFSPTQRGRYAVQVSEDSDPLDVLAGLYTTKEFKAAMDEADAYAAQTRPAMGLLGKVWTRFATETKMAKVPLNPDSWVTNFLGGVVMNAGNGVSPIPLTGKGVKALQDAAGILYTGYGKTAQQRVGMAQQRLRDMRARLVAEGVYHSNVALNDLDVSLSTVAGDMLEGSQLADRATGALRLGYYGKELGESIGGAPGAVVGGALGAATGAAVGGKRTTKAIQSFASKVIGAPDNFWKIVGFLDEFETYKRAYPNLSDVEVARMAAENVKNTRPTYSKIPQGLKTISRYGFINSFFQFNYEMFRNTFHTAGLAAWEMKSGNPVLQAKGAKRMAGLAAMIGLTAVPLTRAFSSYLSGMDDEKQKAFQRSFAPPWDKNGDLLYTEAEPGQVSYVNPQYLVPYNEITKGLSAVSEGGNPEEVAKNIFDTYAEDFFASGVHVTPLIEAYVNQKNISVLSGKKGSPITNQEGVGGFAERLDYVLDKTIRPGAAEKAKRLTLALTGEQADYGKKYTVDEQLKRSMGLRVNNYDVKKSLYFRLRDIREAATRAKMVASSAEIRGVDPASLQAKQAYANEKRAAIKREYVQILADTKTLGISDRDVKEAVKKAGVPLDLRK